MNKKLELLKEKISKNEPVVGASTTFTDCTVTELLAEVGYDFNWIDTEHTRIDKNEVVHHLMANKGTNCASFIRIPWNDPVLVKPILEFGPDGVIFPFINTPEQAEQAVKSCKYPPEGFRGWGPKRANKYGTMNEEEYIKNAYSQFWTIIQVEHVESIENLDEILSVDGIDAIMVGPSDLSASVGLIRQTNHKNVKEEMDKIAEVVNRHDVIFGAVAGNNPQIAKEWLDRGADMIRVGSEFGQLKKAAQNIYEGIVEVW